MKLPSREEALRLISEAEQRNPGPWIAHSRYTAQAAELLAACHPHLEPEYGYILGLLHDIGRRDGIMDLRHAITGYRFMRELGYEDAARICLTHAFPLQDIRVVGENWDGTTEEFAFLADYLTQVEYDGYDHLIQICDAVALPTGFCLLEKRLLDVALRRGVNAYTVSKWRANMAIEQEFEAVIGQSIYVLLPGVVETTFGMPHLQHEMQRGVAFHVTNGYSAGRGDHHAGCLHPRVAG